MLTIQCVGSFLNRHGAYLCKPLLSVVDWLSFVLRCNCAAVWLYRSRAIWPEKKRSLPEKTQAGNEVRLHRSAAHKSAPASPYVACILGTNHFILLVVVFFVLCSIIYYHVSDMPNGRQIKIHFTNGCW